MLNAVRTTFGLTGECMRRSAPILMLALFVAVWANNASSARSTWLAPAPHEIFKAANTAVPLALSIAPAVVVGGAQTTATITLSSPAPAGGIEITLRSLNAQVARFGGAFAAIGTSQLRIAEGSVSATFPVRTFGVVNVTDVTLQALSLGDIASATVTVKPASVKTLAISPGRVVGGVGANGTVTLDGIAPASAGVTVPLSVNRLSTATAPQSVIVAAGASSATFVLTTNPVPADTLVRIVAGHSAGSGISDGTSNTISVGESTAGSASAVLTVLAPVVSTLSLNPQSVPGGASSAGTVVLSGKAPAGGITLGLSSSSNDTSNNVQAITAGSILSLSGATVPQSLTIPAGADRQDFQITTQAVGSPRTVAINVLAHNNLQPTLGDGSVRSVSPAISDGTSNTVIVGGTSSRAATANLSITPSILVTAQPSPATGGAPVAITLMVQPDPAGSAPLALTTDHPELLQVPSTVVVPNSTALQRVIVNAPTNAASADQSVTITASRGSIAASTTLLIKQTPPPLASFTLRPTTVTGGQNIIAQFALTSTAPDSVIVNLATDHPELVTLPPTVTVTRRFPASLTLRTSPTTAQTTVTITASTGTQTTSVTVNVAP